ncbi:NAD-binding Rossmann fold oxidoreductase [Coprinopsis marcescibilis]|uniref:NAD-binding Rossmann fold oxidoreductase n=1 Tax=Coprinopsis marcescibilis TaxID=230819 RepID=A0A5C3KN51_COPMA|nr:NAD-binding Rossmann fold oxidoreductase [Coprinopsis marcescibilis]
MSSPSSGSPLRLGYVGLSSKGGWASMTQAYTLLDPEVQNHFKLVAVGTTNPTSASASAEAYTTQFGREIKGYAGDASQIAESDDVDVVAISVKSTHHFEIAKKVIEAGKPFFLEWPAGRNVQETEELAKLAKEKGVRSLIGIQGRQSGVWRKLKSEIEAGKIGKVYTVAMDVFIPAEFQAWAPATKHSYSYIHDKANGVPSIVTGLGHIIDGLLLAVGPLSRLSARGTTLFPTISILAEDGNPTGKTVPSILHDHYTVVGTLKNGGGWVTITFRQGLSAATPGRRNFSVNIDGDQGTIKVEGGDLSADPKDVYVNGEQLKVSEAHESVIGFLKSAWLEFAKGKENGGQYPDIEDALEHRKFCDAIQTSLENDGVWVDI